MLRGTCQYSFMPDLFCELQLFFRHKAFDQQMPFSFFKWLCFPISFSINKILSLSGDFQEDSLQVTSFPISLLSRLLYSRLAFQANLQIIVGALLSHFPQNFCILRLTPVSLSTFPTVFINIGLWKVLILVILLHPPAIIDLFSRRRALDWSRDAIEYVDRFENGEWGFSVSALRHFGVIGCAKSPRGRRVGRDRWFCSIGTKP